jgi:hypothetical protein
MRTRGKLNVLATAAATVGFTTVRTPVTTVFVTSLTTFRTSTLGSVFPVDVSPPMPGRGPGDGRPLVEPNATAGGGAGDSVGATVGSGSGVGVGVGSLLGVGSVLGVGSGA